MLVRTWALRKVTLENRLSGSGRQMFPLNTNGGWQAEQPQTCGVCLTTVTVVDDGNKRRG